MKQMLIGCCLLALCGSGCTSAGASGVDRNVEMRLTISSGVYGQTTSQDDVGDHAPEFNSMEMSVFQSESGDAPIAKAKSDEVGFYEVALQPGDYSICTSFARCSTFRVEQDQCVRLDYEFSAAIGWATAETSPCPPQ